MSKGWWCTKGKGKVNQWPSVVNLYFSSSFVHHPLHIIFSISSFVFLFFIFLSFIFTSFCFICYFVNYSSSLRPPPVFSPFPSFVGEKKHAERGGGRGRYLFYHFFILFFFLIFNFYPLSLWILISVVFIFLLFYFLFVLSVIFSFVFIFYPLSL